MPFDMDCQDVSEAGALEQLDRLAEIAAGLGHDERAVLLFVAKRLAKGRARYGTLNVAHDPRSFRVEALEEAADGLVYAAAALIQQGRRA